MEENDKHDVEFDHSRVSIEVDKDNNESILLHVDNMPTFSCVCFTIFKFFVLLFKTFYWFNFVEYWPSSVEHEHKVACRISLEYT